MTGRMKTHGIVAIGSLGLLLAGCNSIYDEVYGESYGFSKIIPECGSGAVEGQRYGRNADQARLLCMAELFRRRVTQELPAATPPERLEMWLLRDGFRCGTADSRAEAERVCISLRSTRYRGLFTGTGPKDHVWQVAFRNIVPVLPTVRVRISPSNREEDKK